MSLREEFLSAAREGNNDKVIELLEQVEDVNFVDEHGNTALMLAVRDGHLEMVRALLEHQGIDVNLSDKCGNTALMIAALYGRKDVVETLLQRGANVNLSGTGGNTALMIAVSDEHLERDGNLEMVRALLKHQGIDVNLSNNYGETALMRAVRHGHKDVVEILLQSGANVNFVDEHGNTALMIVALRGHKDVVEILLQSGADVNFVDKDGNTALMLAVRYCHKDVVEILLQSGANVNFVDEHGNTALMIAATNGHVDIFAKLLAAGADKQSFAIEDVPDEHRAQVALMLKFASSNNGEYLSIDDELLTMLQNCRHFLTEEGKQTCQHLVTKYLLNTRHTDMVIINIGAQSDKDASLATAANLLANTSVTKVMIPSSASPECYEYWVGACEPEENNAVQKALAGNVLLNRNTSKAISFQRDIPVDVTSIIVSHLRDSSNVADSPLGKEAISNLEFRDKTVFFSKQECQDPEDLIPKLAQNISPITEVVSAFFSRSPREGEAQKLAGALPGSVHTVYIIAENPDTAHEWQKQIQQVMPQLML